MKRNRKVKIVATLGPASSDENMIEKLFLAGVDVFRINMSHADHDTMRSLVKIIRNIEKKQGRPIGILADLQGPKLRVGEFAKGKVDLVVGQTFTLDNKDIPGDNTRVYLPHKEIFDAVKPGERLLIDDGKLQLLAQKCTHESIECKVVAGNHISDRKGVSLPDTLLGVGAMTEKDHKDLLAVLEQPIDWIALSFIQRPEDIAEARKISKGKVAILSKIEKPQAVRRINEIVDLSDAVMVARGDLGVEMPLEAVPGIQMDIIKLCRRAGKPVVVATQMLESMITAPVPTRAEVSDVATAVYEGADAIMLSAESAAGAYPEEAVRTMDKIACKIERDSNYEPMIDAQHPAPEPTGADAISLAARQIAETLNLSAIVAYTASGATGIRASRERPIPSIIALSPITETARRLALVWGLHCVVTEDAHNLDDMVERAAAIALREGYSVPGDRIIVTAGVPLGTPGATNMLRIAYVAKEDGKRR
ncbi:MULTISPECIES: pyruvate kinase [Bartonella]|uniref:Pyruvate kinase n=1 Tax=Bartonella choladocola TaxID=2750995 RepID=A0A1U9MKX6_9HYPH|nr:MULTISPECIES: pyruvate kinase [Bartonella]AQT48352.1 pyruvate kinase [Bartonella choladocola]MBH9975029.1 pyruvate kinase [Bartonella choladocola]MBI0014635.1 pyruvate kinase [Bartonella sp. B10834G3]MBI0139339.1 pyruvate kinase [Bartonella choladocola]